VGGLLRWVCGGGYFFIFYLIKSELWWASCGCGLVAIDSGWLRWCVAITGLVLMVEVAMSLASYERDKEKEALKKKKEIIFK